MPPKLLQVASNRIYNAATKIIKIEGNQGTKGNSLELPNMSLKSFPAIIEEQCDLKVLLKS